jgi:hypothetical protein
MAGSGILKKLHPFGCNFCRIVLTQTRDIAAGMGQARDNTLPDRIGDTSGPFLTKLARNGLSASSNIGSVTGASSA